MRGWQPAIQRLQADRLPQFRRVLQNSKTLADNTFWAPTAYILERKDEVRC